jgi:hypothetical protein
MFFFQFVQMGQAVTCVIERSKQRLMGMPSAHPRSTFIADLLTTGNTINASWANLNLAIQAVQSWFSNNNLIVNVEKTRIMQFRNHKLQSPMPPRFLFEDCVIPVSDEAKFLGVHINDRLKCDKNCY